MSISTISFDFKEKLPPITKAYFPNLECGVVMKIAKLAAFIIFAIPLLLADAVYAAWNAIKSQLCWLTTDSGIQSEEPLENEQLLPIESDGSSIADASQNGVPAEEPSTSSLNSGESRAVPFPPSNFHPGAAPEAPQGSIVQANSSSLGDSWGIAFDSHIGAEPEAAYASQSSSEITDYNSSQVSLSWEKVDEKDGPLLHEEIRLNEAWSLFGFGESAMGTCKNLLGWITGTQKENPVLNEIIIEISDIMRKIHTLNPIERGSYTIEDKNGKLWNLLNEAVKIPNQSIVYNRSPDILGSSHHIDSSIQFGMDFPENNSTSDVEKFTPKHLLFGKINPKDTGDNKLFIKFEEAGIGNLLDILKHGIDFIFSGHVNETACREKDIPEDVKKSYEDSIAKYNKEKKPDEPILEPLNFDNPSTFLRGFYFLLWAMGYMDKYSPQVKRICAMYHHLKSNKIEGSFVAACETKGYHKDTLHFRTGNEVVIPHELLEKAMSPSPGESI